jgi:hypothetical protein
MDDVGLDRRKIIKGGLKIQDKQACLIHLAQESDKFWSVVNTEFY